MIPAQLFGGDIPTAGLACTLRFVGDVLQVDGSDLPAVPASAITLHKGGFNDTGLFVEFAIGGTRYSALVNNPADARRLLAAAPPSLRPQSGKFKRGLGAQQAKWAAVVGVLVIVLTVVVGFMTFSRQAAALLATQVPQSWEEKLSKSMLADLKREGQIVDKGPEIEALKAIGPRLTKGSRYTYTWVVVDEPSVNAFAMPGGLVVVHRGLMAQAQSAEELAGVLAHEVQHVEQRHSLQALIHMGGWAAISAVTLGDISGFLAVAAAQAGRLSHSRDLEREADLKGIAALRRAEIPPEGLERFFARMAKDSEDIPPELEILSTHPNSAERQKAIAAEIKARPCTACKPIALDWKAVQAHARSEL